MKYIREALTITSEEQMGSYTSVHTLIMICGIKPVFPHFSTAPDSVAVRICRRDPGTGEYPTLCRTTLGAAKRAIQNVDPWMWRRLNRKTVRKFLK